MQGQSHRKLTTLKSFYKFLLREGIMSCKPDRKITSPKIPKRLPVFVEQDKMEMLLITLILGKASGYPQ